MNVVLKKVRNHVCLAALVALSMTGCALGPKVQPEADKKPTEYTDAWSQYRLKDTDDYIPPKQE